MEQGRPLAEKAAKALAEEIRKSGGSIKDEMIGGQGRDHAFQFPSWKPIPVAQPDVPARSDPRSGIPPDSQRGELFREAYFGLKAVRSRWPSDEPKDTSMS